MTHFLAAWKRRIKGHLKRYRLAWVRFRYGFGLDALRGALNKLGVREGDVLMVHSSLDGFSAFDGKITEIIAVLQAIIGPNGLLLMPTLPFSGSALEWVAGQTVFDVKKTPSRSGLLTELFRRLPQVVRSVHPTHAVAAWGARASLFCQDHPISKTPCGQGSPYAGLLACEGKILFLGVSIESMTFFHTIEEMLEGQMAVSPFTKESFQLQSRTANQELVTTTTRLFNPELSRRRRISKVIPYLQSRKGQWHQVRLGTADLVLLNAADIVAAVADMASEGRFCYDI